MKTLYLSVDLGGTKLRMALLTPEGKIVHSQSLSSDLVREPKDLVKRLGQELNSLAQGPHGQGAKIAGVALGIPGLVDSERGIILRSPHFPLWHDFSLKADLEPNLPFPIFLENDANQAALGEAWFGAGKNWNDFIMLTLGTGVGGGIVVDRKIFHGSEGFAGEVGHMVIDRDGLPGALGIQGTLETFTSLSGLRIQLEAIQKGSRKEFQDDAILELNPASPELPKDLVQLASAGNGSAQGVWREFGEALACGIGSLGNILGIFKFVIGGGLAGAWDYFYEPCLKELPKRMYAATAKKVDLQKAQLGNEAGIIGGIPNIKQGLEGQAH